MEDAVLQIFDITTDAIPNFQFLVQERSKIFANHIDYEAFETKVTAMGEDAEEGRRKGLGLWMLGKYEPAAFLLGQHAEDTVAAFTRANAYMSLGQPADAFPIYKRLSDAYPEEPKPRGGMLDAQLDEILGTETDDVAADKLEASLSEAPNSFAESAEGQYLQGRIAELRRDWDSALDCFAAARVVDPTHRRNLFRLAHLCGRYGIDDISLECYESLMSLLPIDRNVLLNIGIAYEDVGRDQEAASCYDVIVNHMPTDKRARLYLHDAKAGMIMFYDEDKEKKEDSLNRILRIPITDFELSVRSRNSLNKMQVMTLGDLCRKTEAELLSFKNFGETSLSEIKEILGKNGLRLGMDRQEAAASVAKMRGSQNTGYDPDDLHNKPISDLKLSIRARRTVENLGALTLGDICQHSEQELLGMPNFGATSLVELKNKLNDHGLNLKSD